MKVITLGRLQIIIEFKPKKDPRAFEKLMLMRQRSLKMTEEDYDLVSRKPTSLDVG